MFCKAAGSLQRLDKRLVEKVSQIVDEGITSTSDVTKRLRTYVTEDLFDGGAVPCSDNRRFFPTPTDVRNHVKSAVHKKAMSDIYPEQVEILVKTTDDTNPDATDNMIEDGGDIAIDEAEVQVVARGPAIEGLDQTSRYEEQNVDVRTVSPRSEEFEEDPTLQNTASSNLLHNNETQNSGSLPFYRLASLLNEMKELMCCVPPDRYAEAEATLMQAHHALSKLCADEQAVRPDSPQPSHEQNRKRLVFLDAGWPISSVVWKSAAQLWVRL